MIFRLSAKVTVSAYTDVDADTLDAAIAEAEKRSVGVGGERNGNPPDEEWVIDDGDGTPYEIKEG
jgi:hypothetical protein